ncbi:MAG: hypothetical protein RIE59_24830 [Imperialibacter sp.]
MKAVPLFLTGLLLWITSKAFDGYYWVHQIRLSEIALFISLLSAILWLRNKENRTSLASAFRVKSFSDLPRFLEDGSYLVLLSVMLFIIIVLAQVPDFYVTRTSAYKQFEQVIRSDSTLQSDVGGIKDVGLGSFSHKTRKNTETMFAILTIFGERQTLTVRADAIMVDGQWIVKLDRD